MHYCQLTKKISSLFSVDEKRNVEKQIFIFQNVIFILFIGGQNYEYRFY